jgi:hypothetical protein
MFVRLVLILSLSAAAAPLQAQARTEPAALRAVLDCRAIADDQVRLACFDSGVASLANANAKGDIAVVDREQVRETRRSLFGFSLPSLAIFGDGKNKSPQEQAREDELKEVTAKVSAVGRTRDGGWAVTLDDEARWEQTDAVTLGRSPRVGSTATVRRGALGSYKMNVDGGPSFKVRRTR